MDRTFFTQDESSFQAAFIPKVHAMRVLEQVVVIDKLDFFSALEINTFNIWYIYPLYSTMSRVV